MAENQLMNSSSILSLHSHSELHDFIIHTEEQINYHEKNIPDGVNKSSEWTMWLNLDKFSAKFNDKLSLKKIVCNHDWADLLDLRCSIEKEFGITDKSQIKGLIAKPPYGIIAESLFNFIK